MSNLFSTKIHKNCRKFYKRMYDFDKPIDIVFVEGLESFGTLKVEYFSKIIPTAKDVFSVKGKNGLEISGAIDDNSILLVIPLNEEKHFEDFEGLLLEYLE